eukprot:2997356-Amphidinium_carterae.1
MPVVVAWHRRSMMLRGSAYARCSAADAHAHNAATTARKQATMKDASDARGFGNGCKYGVAESAAETTELSCKSASLVPNENSI